MQPKLGILAGSGEMPARLIDECRRSGREFFVIAFEGHTPAAIVANVPHAWVRLGAVGKAIELLHGAAVRDVLMVGAIRRPSLSELRPDGRAARILAKAGAALFGDNRLLSAITSELEAAEGFRVVGVESILTETLARLGPYGAVTPNEAAASDIAVGVEVARRLGALDVGQGVIVQQGLVLAVEAIEGTDAMLARAATLRRDGPGGVLVKVKKPGQDGRADLPTIGVATLEAAHTAGLQGVAIEAGGALVVDPKAVAAAADRLGLFVVGVPVAKDGQG
ncbi:MAG: LpxI family protein [Rhodospirillales bacterium]|nr:LpxI family protein [Rhodospirillales bacterium]